MDTRRKPNLRIVLPKGVSSLSDLQSPHALRQPSTPMAPRNLQQTQSAFFKPISAENKSETHQTLQLPSQREELSLPADQVLEQSPSSEDHTPPLPNSPPNSPSSSMGGSTSPQTVVRYSEAQQRPVPDEIVNPDNLETIPSAEEHSTKTCCAVM